ncbi:MAG: EI24 domain-containing protein [Bacteroidota bacterium]
MIQNYFSGFFSFWGAFSFLSKHKLWSYVMIPGLISLVVAGLIFSGAYASSDDLGHWLIGFYPFEWGKETFEWVAGSLSFVLMIIVALLIFKYLVMVIVSPFMGTLSEKVESKITGKPAPNVSVKAMISDMVRGIRIALRNLFREIFLVIFLTIAGSIFGTIIPIIGGLLPAILIFLVQAYFIGFGNLDYLLERKRYGIKESVRFARKYKWMAMGNGTAFTLLLFVPILGWFLAPAMGTTGATIDGLKKLEREQ